MRLIFFAALIMVLDNLISQDLPMERIDNESKLIQNAIEQLISRDSSKEVWFEKNDYYHIPTQVKLTALKTVDKISSAEKGSMVVKIFPLSYESGFFIIKFGFYFIDSRRGKKIIRYSGNIKVWYLYECSQKYFQFFKVEDKLI